MCDRDNERTELNTHSDAANTANHRKKPFENEFVTQTKSKQARMCRCNAIFIDIGQKSSAIK